MRNPRNFGFYEMQRLFTEEVRSVINLHKRNLAASQWLGTVPPHFGLPIREVAENHVPTSTSSFNIFSAPTSVSYNCMKTKYCKEIPAAATSRYSLVVIERCDIANWDHHPFTEHGFRQCNFKSGHRRECSAHHS